MQNKLPIVESTKDFIDKYNEVNKYGKKWYLSSRKLKKILFEIIGQEKNVLFFGFNVGLQLM